MKKTILFCVALAGLTAMSSCGNKAATKLENAADSASYALGVSNGARFGEALKSGMYEQLKNIDPNDFMKGLAAALKTDSTQRSYEMGLSQGLYIKEMLNNIKQGTGVEIDIPTFVQAYKQAMDGDTTLLISAMQSNSVLDAIFRAAAEAKEKEELARLAETPEAKENLAKGEAFLAEKAKEEQTLSQLEKDKENNKKLSARQAAAQRRAEIKKLRRENTLREKEEAKAAKKKAKEDALAKKQAEKEAKKKTSPKKKQATQNKAGVAAAPSVQQKEQPKKPLLINLDKVSKKEKQQATQQTAAPAVQEQKPQKSQKSAIDNILKKEAKKKEEPIKEEKQAESKAEVTKPEKKEPAIVPVVKASSVQEQTTEKPTHQPVKAPQKEEVTVTDSKKADVREVPDLVDSHNVFYGIGASQGNEFVLDDDEKGGNSL